MPGAGRGKWGTEQGRHCHALGLPVAWMWWDGDVKDLDLGTELLPVPWEMVRGTLGDLRRACVDRGSRTCPGATAVCVVNTQRPTHQIWLAADARAWHFSWDEPGAKWLDDKGQGVELFAKVADIVKQQAGVDVAKR